MALERKLNKMRSFTIPRLSTSTLPAETQQDSMASHLFFAPGHSRDSSSASSNSSPLTPTFSTRGHARWPSSSSSLATSPDSPLNVSKATLEDLVEEAEKDDVLNDFEPDVVDDEPFCICDTPYCEHRRSEYPTTSLPEWSLGDDAIYNHALGPRQQIRRSTSTEFARNIFGSRKRHRWNSTSGRFLSKKPTLSVSGQTVRSAPPTPGGSRRPSASQSLMSTLDPRQTVFLADSPAPYFSDRSWATSVVEPSENVDIANAVPTEDPVDREGLSSTPILPHLLSQLRDSIDEPVQSPLQSPTIASYSERASMQSPPPGLLTPPLSAKPSITSMGIHRGVGQPDDEPDVWAMRLGHANFHIQPEPYFPGLCTEESCKRLLDDWEAARMEYLRIISRVSEHYGPSSPTYKLSEAKWAEIDKEWRTNFERANADAEAHGEKPVSQCLAETQPLAKMPSLTDPNRPTKFLNVAEDDIVGPMVQYAKPQPTSPKRTGFFSILKDPASLLGRSVFASKR